MYGGVKRMCCLVAESYCNEEITRVTMNERELLG